MAYGLVKVFMVLVMSLALSSSTFSSAASAASRRGGVSIATTGGPLRGCGKAVRVNSVVGGSGSGAASAGLIRLSGGSIANSKLGALAGGLYMSGVLSGRSTITTFSTYFSEFLLSIKGLWLAQSWAAQLAVYRRPGSCRGYLP